MSEKGRQHCGSLGKASYLYVEVLAHVELAELHAALQTPASTFSGHRVQWFAMMTHRMSLVPFRNCEMKSGQPYRTYPSL